MRRILCIFSGLVLHAQVTCQSFNDITLDLGIEQHPARQEYGSGASLFDFNSDGWIDIHVSTAYGEPDRIYQNVNGEFIEASDILGLDRNTATVTSIWFDYNNDRLPDLLTINSCFDVEECNLRPLNLYMQQENGTFIDVTTDSGLDLYLDEFKSQVVGGLGVGDLNLDGFLDIVQTSWGESYFLIFINDGEGHFIEKTRSLGIDYFEQFYFQPQLFDFDHDDDIDIYLNVDRGPNQLFVNDNFVFENKAAQLGMNSNNNEMGMAIGDYNNNGLFDIFMTNVTSNGKNNVLLSGYETSSGYSYEDRAESMNVTKSAWGWGTTFLDADNDGFQDLAATNGGIFEDRSYFWKNENGQSFMDVSDEVGFDDLLYGLTLLSSDLDRDGDLDLVQTFKPDELNHTSFKILNNECAQCGNYLIVQPRMTNVNRFAIGAMVEVMIENKPTVRLISAGTSYYGQEPAEAHFGLGEHDKVDRVKVTWPGGAITTLDDVDANQIVMIEDADIIHAPRFIDGEITNTGNELSWSHMSTKEINFEIEKSLSPIFSNPIKWVLPNTERSYKDVSNELELSYYRIRARIGESFSKWSPVLIVAKLFKPTNLKLIKIGSSEIRISWEDMASTESAYLIERSTTPTFELKLQFVINANQTEFSDQNFEPGVTYFYRVAALKGETQSEFSNVVSSDLVLETINSNEIIFPNPVSNSIKVPTSFIKGSRIEIWGLNGRVYEANGSADSGFNVGFLPSGFYLIRGIGGALRFVKQ